jgi:CheY-like chemotaxis protein
MDGATTIRSLRHMKPGLKTIMITGLGEEGRVAEAKAAGSDLVLSKPFTAEQLLMALKQLLG